MVPIRRHARNWLAYLACGGLGLALGLVASKRKQESPRKNTAYRPNNYQEPAKPKPPSQTYEHYAHPSEGEHRTYEQFSGRHSFALNVGIAVVVFFTFIAATGTYFATKRQADDGHQSLIANTRPYLNIADINRVSGEFGPVINLINVGNTTATNISVSVDLREFENTQAAIEPSIIKCNVKILPYVTFKDQPKVILPKGSQTFNLNVDTHFGLKYFLPREKVPFLVGCIEYSWSTFNTDKFHTYFILRAHIVDSRNGNELRSPIMSAEVVPEEFMRLRLDARELLYLSVD